MSVVLGSSSEFRAALLSREEINFSVIEPGIDEKAIRNRDPKRLVELIGVAKSDAVVSKLTSKSGIIVVTGDHVLVLTLEGKQMILEKPLTKKGRRSRIQARKMLSRYGKGELKAINSLVVYRLDSNHRSLQIDEAEIFLRPFSKTEIEEMVEDPYTYKAAGALPIGIPGSKACKIVERHLIKTIGSKDCMMGMNVIKLKRTLSAYSNSSVVKA